MARIGYTRNGFKETCRYDYSNGGACVRHVRHSDSVSPEDKLSDIIKHVEDNVAPSYKITFDGLYAFNCGTCSGSGVMFNQKCVECEGNGWDESARFNSLTELEEAYRVKTFNKTSVTDGVSVPVSSPVGTTVKNKNAGFLPYMLGDLVKISGTIVEIKNLHTRYGATVMVMLETSDEKKVVFFSKNRWVNRLSVDSELTVRGYVKDFKVFNDVQQTVLRQVSPV